MKAFILHVLCYQNQNLLNSKKKKKKENSLSEATVHHAMNMLTILTGSQLALTLPAVVVVEFKEIFRAAVPVLTGTTAELSKPTILGRYVFATCPVAITVLS